MQHFNQLIAYYCDLAGKSRQHPEGWGERSFFVTLLVWKNDNSIFISLLLPALKSFALAFIFPLLYSNYYMWDTKFSSYHSSSNSSLAGRMGGLAAVG